MDTKKWCVCRLKAKWAFMLSLHCSFTFISWNLQSGNLHTCSNKAARIQEYVPYTTLSKACGLDFSSLTFPPLGKHGPTWHTILSMKDTGPVPQTPRTFQSLGLVGMSVTDVYNKYTGKYMQIQTNNIPNLQTFHTSYLSLSPRTSITCRPYSWSLSKNSIFILLQP